MKAHGYCYKCHKIKLVRVSPIRSMTAAGRIVPTGTCDDCERKVSGERKR